MYEYTKQVKPASSFTRKENQKYYDMLDFDDRREFDCAKKNLIDAPEHLEIRDDSGKVVWSQRGFEFLRDESRVDETINPSLWINAHLNHQYGLFKVTDGIYQVRGYDMSNLTVVEGERGWIVFDPLISCECARAAMDLIRKNLGERPVSAIVISHPHTDHFGGIKGIGKEEEIQEGKIPLIVPHGYMHHAVKENCYTFRAVARRSSYQYGPSLPQGKTGTLSMGIGMGQSRCLITFIRPTDEIQKTGDKRVIDGVEFEFLMAPDTESPAEMCWYLPQFKALWMAELCNATMHNLYTLRGTQVRDGNAWAGYLFEAQQMWGQEAEVVFTAHNWPHWGKADVNEYLENTAAVYKYINDQTVMYLNQGFIPNEISHLIRLPRQLEQVWYTRGYYGTLSHNSKAVYQRYMGWYDGNPVNLNPLTPSDEGRKMVEYMGGADAVLLKAEKDMEKGEYQWVAKVCNEIVFADPGNEKARLLCADAMEQLGYQSESGPWRNAYLMGAYELRHGIVSNPEGRATDAGDVVRCMDTEMMFDYLGMMIDCEKSADKDIRMDFIITDTKEEYYVHFYHGVLLYTKGRCKAGQPDAVLTMPRQALASVISGKRDLWKKLIKIEGKQDVLEEMTEHAVTFRPLFPIVEP